jgi:hypothetical protein
MMNSKLIKEYAVELAYNMYEENMLGRSRKIVLNFLK